MTIPGQIGPIFAPSNRCDAVVAFSWFLVLSLSTMPIADQYLGRSTSLIGPGCIVVVGATVSALLLRQRHPWLRLVLHIYGQIMIGCPSPASRSQQSFLWLEARYGGADVSDGLFT